MATTSPHQADAFSRGIVPSIETVRPGIFAIPLAMSQPWLPYSLCFALEGDSNELHLIDTGVDSEPNWQAFVSALESIGHVITDVASLTITHLHHDHAGLAARLQAAAGTTVRMQKKDAHAIQAGTTFMDSEMIASSLVEWRVPESRREEITRAASRRVATAPEFVVDTLLDGTESFGAGGRTLRLLPTPGHTTGHIVVAIDDEKILFSGDHLLPEIHPGIGLGGRSVGDDPIQDYFDSLEIVAALEGYEVCPGHGYRFTGLGNRCAEIKHHHTRRALEVSAVLANDAHEAVWNIASRLTWTAGWSNLKGTDLFSALAQTSMHVQRARPR